MFQRDMKTDMKANQIEYRYCSRYDSQSQMNIDTVVEIKANHK